MRLQFRFRDKQPPIFMNRRPDIYRILILGFALLAFVGVNGLIVRKIYQERRTEAQFQQEFGDTWKDHYDQRNGPGSLQLAQTRITVSYVGMPVITLLIWLIYRQATKDRSGGTGRPRRPRKYKQKSEW